MRIVDLTNKPPFTMIAKTVSGLEEVLEKELKDLGAIETQTLKRAVLFKGNKELLYKCNYRCRMALRVLLPFRHFTAASEKELYRNARDIDWPALFDIRQTFVVDAVLTESNLTHSQYVAQLVKDGIADRFRDKMGRRPDVDIENPDIRVNVHIYDNQCDISLDSSGTSLHKRAYRVSTHDAPLNEVLAAGMIALSGWDKQSAFVDPMCGSGTLLIEGLMAALNVPAGYSREDYAFMHWADYEREVWEEVCAEAKMAILPEPAFEFVGNDISRKSIYQARANLEAACLTGKARLVHGDFRRLEPPPAPGILFTNPPYGERMQVEDVEALYRELGNMLKRKYPSYKAFVLSSDIMALKMVGLRPFCRIKVFNGPLECRVFGFDLYQGKKGSQPG